MYYLNKDEELTITILNKMFNDFNINVLPKLEKYKSYYEGIQAIATKSYSDESKPCNKAITNFCKNIADAYCGYLASGGYISYTSEQDIEDIMNVLNYNDYQCEDSDFLLDALVFGRAHEFMYYDENSKLRFTHISPLYSFGIFDDRLNGELTHFVRWARKNDWDDSIVNLVDVYDDVVVRHYEMSGDNGFLTFLGEEPHYMGQCPANVFELPSEKPIFECIMELQDAYNEIYNNNIDDFDAFVDAFLVLQGVDADADDITSMKENRVILLPNDSTATWLTKNTSEAPVESLLKRTQESIYRIAQCPDFSSESFVGGVSSGIAIRYRLCGMENRASKVEALMKKALQRRIEIICGASTLTLGEEIFRDIHINFTRNIPTDGSDVVQIVNALQGIVSDETLLSFIPQIDNPQEELERVNKEKEEKMSLYNFSFETGDDEE